MIPVNDFLKVQGTDQRLLEVGSAGRRLTVVFKVQHEGILGSLEIVLWGCLQGSLHLKKVIQLYAKKLNTSDYKLKKTQAELSVNKLSLVLSHGNKYIVTVAKLLLVNISQSLKASVTSCFVFQLNGAFDFYVRHMKHGSCLKKEKISLEYCVRISKCLPVRCYTEGNRQGHVATMI